MAWVTPVTDWEAADVVGPDDMNRIEGNTNEIELGSRTIDDAIAIPEGGEIGTLRAIVDYYATQIKNIIGRTKWNSDLSTNLYKQYREYHVSGNWDGTVAYLGTKVVQKTRLVLADGEAVSVVRYNWDLDDTGGYGRLDVQANAATSLTTGANAGYEDSADVQLILNSTGSPLDIDIKISIINARPTTGDIDIIGGGWCVVLGII